MWSSEKNLAQRPAFPGLRFFNKIENPRLGTNKSLQENLCLGLSLFPEKSIEHPGFEPTNLMSQSECWGQHANRYLYLQITASDDKQLTLMDVTKDTADIYRCEVSSDAPVFMTVEAQAELKVLGKLSYNFISYDDNEEKYEIREK